MKKIYSEPQVEILRLEEDMVRTSSEPEENKNDNTFEFPWINEYQNKL